MLCTATVLKPDGHHDHLQSLWSIQMSALLPHWFWGLARSYPKGNRIAFSWSFRIRHEVSGIHADERLNHEIFELFWIRQRGKSFITLFSILWHFIIQESSKCKYFANSSHPVSLRFFFWIQAAIWWLLKACKTWFRDSKSDSILPGVNPTTKQF